MKNTKELLRTLNIKDETLTIIKEAENKCRPFLDKIDDIMLYNQAKVLTAFQQNRIGQRHMTLSTGYGYDDIGRDELEQLYACIFKTEDALVRPQIVSGTHALALCLYGILRPGDELLSITGRPYDTLEETIGIRGREENGSLKEFGVLYNEIDINALDIMDKSSFDKYITEKTKVIFIQRSKGYQWRPSLSIEKMKEIINILKDINKDLIIVIDNCYGEFTQRLEPTEVGADIIAGSLIKNPGGGLCPTGGYIAGPSDLIERIAYRYSSPGIGKEVGSYAASYLPFYQGLFMAPHVVGQAIKGAILYSAVFKDLGYEVNPQPNEERCDIIQSIKFPTAKQLISFCQGIQKGSPIDSYVQPEPWDMPGYDHKVIMAAGTFIQGASIELSADAPIKPPYIAYVQGGLTYEHAKIGLATALQTIQK
ncbi:MAG: aminotransferase class I/II-fold pyridoxal phosphate-dependent enzyme [Mahellales bacterium]|jgi:cystathionine beta-lyase family protein involved in aluminum resistance